MKHYLTIVGLFVYFVLPFTFIKAYYNLGFNQAAGESSGVGLSDQAHWEIFPSIWHSIWSFNNYGNAWIVLLLLIVAGRHYRKNSKLLLLLVPLVLFGVFTAVFLLTGNYTFVLDQTTVNRVFTMVFVILFSYLGVLLDENNKESMEA